MIACLYYEVAMTQMQDVTGVFCDGCVVCSSPMGSHWQTIVGGVRRSTIGKRCLAVTVDHFVGLHACSVTLMGNLLRLLYLRLCDLASVHTDPGLVSQNYYFLIFH